MSLLNFKDSDDSSVRKPKGIPLFIGIGTLVGTIVIGSTLAASINLNNGGPVEFGQGVTQTTSCDSQVEVTPTSSFVNADGGGDFKFSAITLSDLDGTDQSESSEGCAGKSFTIKAYDSYGYQLQPSYEISVDSDGNFTSSSGETDGTLEGAENSSVTMTFFSGILTSAESVYRITIESEDLEVVEPVSYQLGEPGPGGGNVFYVSDTPFLCGPTREQMCTYLESAPADWYSTSDPGIRWAQVSLASTSISNTSSPETAIETAIGWGYWNTRAIIGQGNTDINTSAAALADSYTITVSSIVFDDWYLPSKDELDLIYLEKEIVGGTTAVGYWSSSEDVDNAGKAWSQSFNTGNSGSVNKGFPYRVRPVRAF